MNRADVHMLTLPSSRADWMACALADMRDEPASIHIVRGTDGHIGQGRAHGFALGCEPYLSFIDPDDRYPAGGLRKCLSALEIGPDIGLVYTSELMVRSSLEPVGYPDLSTYNAADHRLRPKHVHGLMVFRRAAVAPYLSEIATFARLPEWRLTTRIAERWRVVKLPIVGRLWRQHANNSIRLPDPDGLAAKDRERIRA